MLWTSGGSYRAWADHLQAWADGRAVPDAPLPRLAPPDFAPETWVRLVERIRAALDQRLGEWSRHLTEAMAAASDEFQIGRALAQARHGLGEIRALAGHPKLPEDLRDRLRAAVDERIRETQRTLEQEVENARRLGVDPRLLEARLRAVRDNALTAALDGPPPAPGADPWRHAGTTPRRRVITD
ncbi:hypothetical protein ABZ615_11845 [Streptomyces sp. NPDC007325]|uniref:hypothetical protein n=1 Tax=unclassified Streptomyces TaxID=2593676 RepID=UPI0033F52FB5